MVALSYERYSTEFLVIWPWFRCGGNHWEKQHWIAPLQHDQRSLIKRCKHETHEWDLHPMSAVDAHTIEVGTFYFVLQGDLVTVSICMFDHLSYQRHSNSWPRILLPIQKLWECPIFTVTVPGDVDNLTNERHHE